LIFLKCNGSNDNQAVTAGIHQTLQDNPFDSPELRSLMAAVWNLKRSRGLRKRTIHAAFFFWWDAIGLEWFRIQTWEQQHSLWIYVDLFDKPFQPGYFGGTQF
jgi:sulfite reductase beta subunit-like hemoprotein